MSLSSLFHVKFPPNVHGNEISMGRTLEKDWKTLILINRQGNSQGDETLRVLKRL